MFDAADPALAIDPLVCKGFWDGGDCDATTPITVDVGSAGAGDNPSILALFPNDRPHRSATVVDTTTYREVPGGGGGSGVSGARTVEGSPVAVPIG